ncbi:MAG: cysteate synthase [Thermoclostridium sp.]|nr:cysteate synthase [Thermoclostridium sp.]
MLNHEKLVCLGTGEQFTDDGLVLSNRNSPKPAFLRAKYHHQHLTVRKELPGLYQFSDWLPINRILQGSASPVTYHSQGLGKHLGLPRLYITFNGYCPEKGARMMTGTFKECEAFSVCARFPKESGKVLVVASAGNTARAFMKVASENEIPLVVVVPEKNMGSLWHIDALKPCVKIIAAGGDSDYTDAIRLSDLICGIEGFYPEGGAKNVARRDGMGTTVLSAVTTIGEIPDYYFQAVGSGTGAIAAHESNLRFNQSGKYGQKIMSLQCSQNEPFVPIYNSWKSGSSTIPEMDEDEARQKVDAINAKVLSNRKPPYSLVGGLYDCLKASSGDMLTATNAEAAQAQKLFRELEGCDICPEGGIALASLIKKLHNGNIQTDAIVMLNITGGGFERLAAEYKLIKAKADLVIDRKDFIPDKIQKKVLKLMR